MSSHSSLSPSRAALTSSFAVVLLLSCGGSEFSGSEDIPWEAEATVTPRPGMLDVEPVTYWYGTSSVDEHTLVVAFASQGPPCEVLDHVELDETGNRMTVTLYHGRDPASDPADPCDGPPADRVFEVEIPVERDLWVEDDAVLVIGSSGYAVDVEAMVTPRPGMLDPQPVRWWYDYQQGWDWGHGDNDHTMLVTFPSQGAPCQVLDRVEFNESDGQATITLYQGRHPDIDPDEPCDGPTHVAGVDVPLMRDYGPTPYTRPGLTAERGEGAVTNGGSLPDRR
jgi:hypothetical protein